MKENNVNNYQKEADKLVKEIYNEALLSKTNLNIHFIINELLTKNLDFKTWKTYYKKFKKYLANKLLDITHAQDFALALSTAKVDCNSSDLLELQEIRSYLSEFINLLGDLKNNEDPKMLRVINCLDLNLVYNNIITNINNKGISR